MLWDLLLFFAALALAAMGVVNLGTAPIWFGLALLCLVAIIVREIMARRGHWSRPETDHHKLARQLRPVIDAGQMLLQAAKVPNEPSESAREAFVKRVAEWEARARTFLAKHADDYSDLLSKAISGDLYIMGASGWRHPLDRQRRDLARSLLVLRAIAAGTPPKDIDLDGPRKAIEQGFPMDLAPAPSKLVWTPAELVADIGPNDLIRAFRSLYLDGEAVIDALRLITPAAPDGALEAGLAAHQTWIDKCLPLIQSERPDCEPAFDDAQQTTRGLFANLVYGGTEWEEPAVAQDYIRRAEKVRALLDRIVRGQDCAGSLSRAISPQDRT